MSAETFEAAVGPYLSSRPFRPFTLVLNDGTRLEVDHPSGFLHRAGTGGHLDAAGMPTLFRAGDVSEVVGDLGGGSGVS